MTLSVGDGAACRLVRDAAVRKRDERHRAVSRIGDHGDGENALGVRDARGVLHRGRWFEVRHPRESHRALGIRDGDHEAFVRAHRHGCGAGDRTVVSSPSPRVAARDVTLLETIASVGSL